MSDFTIEQLEALKEGTTPGPWGHTSLGYEAKRYPVYGDVPGDEVALVRRQDWELVSAAPTLVDALIAEKRENQSIRAELEEVLDIVKHETWLHDDEGQFPETVQLGSYVAGQLTLILEADHG